MELLSDLVLGRTVAVVGNSEGIFDRQEGSVIDAHDIVLRMNLGLPWKFPGKRNSMGFRTDVWATARYWPQAEPDGCKIIVWMKRTPLGRSELIQLRESQPQSPILEWPQDLEDACSRYVGASPSTGMRMLWWLASFAAPLRVSTFGFDHWERKSHWTNTEFHYDHNAKKERQAFERLGY